MKKLIQIEYYKYSRSKVFYAFMGLYLALILLLEIISSDKKSFLYSTFPAIWTSLIYTVSYLNVFAGFIVLISVTSEYQYRTLRQHIVDGLEKDSFFASKVIYAVFIGGFTSLFVMISIMIIGLTHGTSNNHSMFEGSQVVADFFVQLMGYLSLAIFAGILFRSTALSVIIYMMYVVALEPLLGWALFHNESNEKIVAFFPKTLFSSIVESNSAILNAGPSKPIIGMVKGAPDHQTRLILACVYILVILGGSYALLKKRDA